MPRMYLADPSFVTQLQEDRKELLEVAKSLGTAENMRAAREELLAGTKVYTAPKAGQNHQELYWLDADKNAHIAIIGELTPHAEKDACGAYTASALTEYGYIQAASIAADNDPRVKEVHYDVDTPGGYVSGVDETAIVIANMKKHTVALVSGRAASGGYWLISQMDEIVAVSPVAQFGSIGVVVEVLDNTKALEARGFIYHTITSTEAPDKRLDLGTAEGKAKLVAQLDAIHGVFVSRVAEGRGTTPAKVNADFGRGGMLIASKALEVGMIDAVRGQSIKKKKAAGVSSGGPSALSKEKEVRTMDLKELQATHPDTYNQAVAAGVAQEQKRTSDLRAFLGINAMGDKAVNEALASGATYQDSHAQIAAAIEKGKVAPAGGENAASVITKSSETGSGVDGVTVLSDEEKKIVSGLGITEAEYIAEKKKEGK